jgi:hypothetical protein
LCESSQPDALHTSTYVSPSSIVLIGARTFYRKAKTSFSSLSRLRR